MSGASTIPNTTSGARETTEPKKGISVFIPIAIVVIVAILIGALVFGVTRDTRTVEEAARHIPGLNELPDGWVTIEDPVGGFVAAMPPDNTADTAPAAPGDPTSSSWTGNIGEETVITVGFTEIDPPPEGQIAQDTLADYADVLVASRPDAKLVAVTESGFRGYPAALVQIRYTGSDVTSKVLLIKKGNEIYTLDSTSVYQDHPSFDRMVKGFAFT